MSTEKTNLKAVPNAEEAAEKDIFEQLFSEETPEYHTILKVWQTTLEPAPREALKKPSADWAAIIVSKWPFLRFQEVVDVHKHYFRIMSDMQAIFDEVIANDKYDLDLKTIEDDIETNREAYIEVLKGWQKGLIQEQINWDASEKDAGPKIAALGEAQQQMLGKNGLVSYLGVINMPFSEEEQTAMTQELIDFRTELEEER